MLMTTADVETFQADPTGVTNNDPMLHRCNNIHYFESDDSSDSEPDVTPATLIKRRQTFHDFLKTRKSKGDDDDDNNDPDWLNQIKNLNTTSSAGLTLIKEVISPLLHSYV